MTHDEKAVTRSGRGAVVLVGRGPEVELIGSFLDRAAAEGGALLLTGDPGVGKTMLLDAAAATAQAAGCRVLRVAGAEFGGEANFSGLGDLLRPVLGERRELSNLNQRALTVTLGLASGSPPDWLAGRWDQAKELADECLELCLAHGYLLQTWTIRYRQALIAAARGAYDTADALTAEMVGWAAPRRIGQADLAAHHVGSVAALGRGDFEDAYRHAAAISPAGVLASHVGYALWVLLDLVEAAVRTGRGADAAAHVEAMRAAGIEVISARLALITAAAAALVLLPVNPWVYRCRAA